MQDVYIVGIGIHPFGRTEGLSGLQQGANAARAAMADAGLAWPDMEFGFGGSDSAGNADTIVNELGLTGLPFINVKNGCATGGSALIGSWQAIASGAHDVGIAIGFDKHPRGAFNAMPAEYSLPDWYGEAGFMVTTQFFAMKLQRYMALHGISPTSLGRVAEKAFRNAVHADHAWRRSPVDLDTILNAPMISDPLTKYMFCSPAAGGVALVLVSAKKAREPGRDQVLTALDRANADALGADLVQLAAEGGRTLIVVTHDAGLAARMGRQITIADGRIVEDTHA